MPRRNDIAKILIIGSGPIVLVLCMFIPLVARACTIFPISVAAAPNFDLLVEDDGRPVSGIPISVTRVGDKTRKPLLESKSDQEGKVHIRGLLPGEYAIDSLGPIQTVGLIAIVKRHGPATLAKPILFHWPWYGIAKSRSLQGTFRGANPQSPFAEVEFTLVTADSGNVIKTFRSGPGGHFDFGDMPSGLYVLQVQAKQPATPKGREVQGPVAVKIDPNSAASPNSLVLVLGESSCGIWYAQCSQRDSITLSSRRIGVTDANGAAVGSAQYVLEDQSGNKVAVGQSNSQGVIDLPVELKGSYKVSIYSAGFTPLEQPLELVAPKSEAKDLNVLLNVGGVCSQAELERHATP